VSFRNRARRAVLGGVLVLGVAGVGLGVWLRSEPITAAGLLLALLQTTVAVVDLVASHRDRHDRSDRHERPGRSGHRDPPAPPPAGDDEHRGELARRLLATRRTEELTPSLPGGATIDLDYVAEAELVTFRSQGDAVAGFDNLVETVRAEGGPLVLVGAPGSGKSLTARRLVTTLLERGALAERFLLWRWDGEPLADWLAAEWAGRGYGLDAAEAGRLVADPAVVLVLDGLDEVPVARRQACVDAVNALVDVHPSLRIVVCCRTREYRALAERVDSRRVRRIAALTPATVAAFLGAHAPPAWDPVRAALERDPALRALLNTPLLLVAALRALRDDPTPLLVGPLPERQHALWDGYVDRMLAQVDQPATSPAARRRMLEDVAITMAATGSFEIGRASRDLRTFMDRCVDRHLLRRAATGYQCIHRHLLGHLVAGAEYGPGPRALAQRSRAPVPSEAWGWHRLGREALVAGHADVAVTMSRRALALEPAEPTFLGDLAFDLLAAWRLEEAVEAARVAEIADPGDWRPPSTLACALFALGDLEGSASAAARAWTNGHRFSGPFLAYGLALRALHDEAGAVLDKLRALDGDDPSRIDRALALAAIGRAGVAADALFPLNVKEYNLGVARFRVPAAAARALVPSDVFEVVEVEPGRTRFNVIVVDHRQSPWGDYDEILFSLLVRPVGGPPDAAGGFIFRRAVNKRYSPDAPHGTLALPGTTADIAVAYMAEAATFELRVQGQRTLQLELPRAAAPDSGPADGNRPSLDTQSYSAIGGLPYVTRLILDEPFPVDPARVRIEVGDGPLADALRTLGLPRTPDAASWGEGLSMTHHLPRPLGAGD
jgi:hypothetical protein